jgi:hypothetical protein
LPPPHAAIPIMGPEDERLTHASELQYRLPCRLMSLDFFFVPLAAKVGASLDQVKVN